MKKFTFCTTLILVIVALCASVARADDCADRSGRTTTFVEGPAVQLEDYADLTSWCNGYLETCAGFAPPHDVVAFQVGATTYTATHAQLLVFTKTDAPTCTYYLELNFTHIFKDGFDNE